MPYNPDFYYSPPPKKKLSSDSLPFFDQLLEDKQNEVSKRLARIFFYLTDMLAGSNGFGYSFGKTKASTDYIVTFYFTNFVKNPDTGRLEEVKTTEKIYAENIFSLLREFEDKFREWHEQAEAEYEAETGMPTEINIPF